MVQLPLIDVSALMDPAEAGTAAQVGTDIDAACRDTGFFLVTGHGIDPRLRDELERLSREFFALPEEHKQQIAMQYGGIAWRGWFPAQPAELRSVVLQWIDHVTRVGQAVLRGIALGLGLDAEWFAAHLTADPTVLFRVFHYPPGDTESWGVGEHTDYGLVTLLAQDHHGGLHVRSGDQWIDVPADPYVFVVNIGDMLERMTRGGYRSNPHRVRNLSGADRLSFPLFLDPSWDATVTPLPDAAFHGDTERWDGRSVHAWEGVYGDYLTAKVAKVFPRLAAALP